MDFLQQRKFAPASWQSSNINPSALPKNRVNLGRFPTPVHRLRLNSLKDYQIYVKRDDISSCDLSGNKVRKLEFLLSDAIDRKCDSVITIGGLQSNHCRATAVASRQLGMEPHLILRTPFSPDKIDLCGNLLWNRMVGSKIYSINPIKYIETGSDNLVAELNEKLRMDNFNPYPIPVGGSNTLGSFGYMECIKEILELDVSFDHIVFACGSGGTAAGLAIGARLSGMKAKLHGIGVCDDEDYFYHHVEDVVRELGISLETFGSPREWLSLYNGQGLGYAKNTDHEIESIASISRESGVIFDPVYSGKAFVYFVENLLVQLPDIFHPSDKILFIHTGGVFGLFDKAEQCERVLMKHDIQDYIRTVG